MKKDDGLDEHNDIRNTLPIHLGGLILSNSKQIMNNFIRERNGFYKSSIYYGDTDSIYIEKQHRNVLEKANLVGKELCQGKSDYESGGLFYGLIRDPKRHYCLTINEFGIIQQHMTFKGFNDSKRLLDLSQSFDKLEGKKGISYVTKIMDKTI